ncbi:Fic family protein [Candidatus Woesearchaeota archaeon]|nr:Fic family protein [Candidatus Woesearchaeota archaeon]
MYIEKRKSGNSIKYYLVHSYRDKNSVQKIRKYLGSNLSKDEINKRKKEAKEKILNIFKNVSTEVFLFRLTKNQIEKLNKYNDKISILHFDKSEWQKFTEEFVYNTNAIEGSSVEKSEVPDILEGHAKNKDEEETKGVANAIEFIRTTSEDLSLNLILRLHELCFLKSKHFAGKLRNVEVVISNSSGEIIHQGIPAKEVKSALLEMVDWYKKNKDKFKPLVLSVLIHNQFEYIHPFQDGNGRVGRLLLNYILIRNNYPPVNINLEDRQEYYKCLRDYDLIQDVKPMLRFIINQYKKTLKKVTTKSKK